MQCGLVFADQRLEVREAIFVAAPFGNAQPSLAWNPDASPEGLD